MRETKRRRETERERERVHVLVRISESVSVFELGEIKKVAILTERMSVRVCEIEITLI